MEATNQLKLYSLSEAAKAMCIGRDTLRDFMAAGKIGYIIVGKSRRITYMELIRFLNESIVRKTEARELKSYSDQNIEKYFHKKTNTTETSLGGDDIFNKLLRKEINGNSTSKR
jgi:excisionase family DNA binding protein